jgi:hypothetical protein
LSNPFGPKDVLRVLAIALAAVICDYVKKKLKKKYIDYLYKQYEIFLYFI